MPDPNRPTQLAATKATPRWHAVLRMLLLLALPIVAPANAWADECGRDGQRACRIDERLPSCDLNLVEGGGRCIRPLCGAEGQRGCGPGERITFDFLLQLPLPKVCDTDLKHDLFKNQCFHPACGRENQNACPVTERLPSCDINLVEQAGRCLHPSQCGRLGEVPCPVIVRGLARRCDVNLIDRANQCVRPGSADTATASTNPAVPAGSTGAAPPPPPRTGAAPPPPPPPRTGVAPPPPPPPPRTSTAPPPPPPPSNAATPAPATPAQTAGAMEVDSDRAGNDMYGFNVAQPDPAMCQATCNYNGQCAAWTYVKPGVQGPSARCYLKSAAAAPTRNNCCVSGAKGGAGPMLLKR